MFKGGKGNFDRTRVIAWLQDGVAVRQVAHRLHKKRRRRRPFFHAHAKQTRFKQ